MGIKVGESLGILDGTRVSDKIDGDEEGLPDVITEGATLGTSLGTDDEIGVGALLGDEDARKLGLLDGINDGSELG